MYDVIVAGAGPAGASASYELANNGFRVLMLDAKKFPRYKTCGGGIPLNFFKTLPISVQQTLETVFENISFLGPKNRRFEAPILKFAGVMREKFDHAFAKAAVSRGAELIEENPVTGIEELPEKIRVRSKMGIFECRYLIGADGATGIVKRRLKLGSTDAASPALEIEIKNARQTKTAVIDFSAARDGYAWIFPKQGYDSVGVVSFGRDRKKLRGLISGWVPGKGYDLKEENLHGHPIPVWKNKLKLSTRRALLAGDAANTVDPFSGEGIRHGIISGRLAAEFILAAYREDAPVTAYDEAVYQRIHRDFKYAGWLAHLFYRFPDFFFKIGVATPYGSKFCGAIMAGELSYRDFFDRCIGRLVNPVNLIKILSGMSSKD